MSKLYGLLPKMDHLLESVQQQLTEDVPRPLVRTSLERFLDGLRADIRNGVIADEAQLETDLLAERAAAHVQRDTRPKFTRVLNATGVVVHTNLGRSLLAEEAIEAVVQGCRHYSNLEFNLATGKRGSRYQHVEQILCEVTGAEAAMVVNNNAAAVLIVLDTFAKGREAIVSRGELVEIGGSFRIPDVMKKSGATLVEVGATNRTHPHDYEEAITENTGMLLKVHASNFRIIGFVKEVSTAELVEIGRRHDVPVCEDLGSGNFSDFAPMGFAFEPTVQQKVAEGVDVITFSGDKVLGGPQAGVIVGRKDYIDQLRANPLNRALRIDKMTLAALEATVRLYVDPERSRTRIPTVAMITAPPEMLADKAAALASTVTAALSDAARVHTVAGVSRVGGGAFPERDLPTTLVAVEPTQRSVEAVRTGLLDTDPPLVGRVESVEGAECLCLDPRTLREDEFSLVADALVQVLRN